MTTLVLLKAVLTLQQPGGVSAPEQRSKPQGIDLPLARDPWGNEYVPATSLAGSFRAHLAHQPRLAERTDELMGHAPDADAPSASALRFLGTHVTTTGIVQRDRTAIDRHRGAAASTTLRRSEHLTPGSTVTVYLQLDEPTLRDDVVAALRHWQPHMGGGRTTGHGQAAVTSLRERVVDFTTPQGRRTWLTTRGPDLFNDEHTTDLGAGHLAAPTPFLSLRWEIVDGLHIGTGRPHNHDEHAIAPVVRDGHGTPCVPGSTWKGVLRARCEFILRTLGQPACAPTFDHNPGHHPGPCGTCLICHAFGWAGPGETTGKRGTLAFHESTVDNAELVQQTHVALDRVFGGAREGQLFTDEVVQAGQTNLTIHDLGNTPQAVHALLVLACHDIHHGLTGLGAATTRGLGTLRLLDDEHTLAEQRQHAIDTLQQLLPAAHINSSDPEAST